MPLQSPAPLQSSRPAGPASPCLLFVDDEQSLLRAFALAFAKSGYEVLEAGDVTQALALWSRERERISLILSDVQMPGPPVEELIAQARGDSPEIPILLMSGEVRGTQQRVDSLLGSVDAFLPKPLRLDALKVEVERHLPPRLPA
jgi:two-component system cell cycle sensor histidine kinase/response regulator CckA